MQKSYYVYFIEKGKGVGKSKQYRVGCFYDYFLMVDVFRELRDQLAEGLEVVKILILSEEVREDRKLLEVKWEIDRMGEDYSVYSVKMGEVLKDVEFIVSYLDEERCFGEGRKIYKALTNDTGNGSKYL